MDESLIPEIMLEYRGKKKAPDFERYVKLSDEYEERYGEVDWNDFSVHDMATLTEIGDALEYCLKKGKRMPQVKPEWCTECPPGCKF